MDASIQDLHVAEERGLDHLPLEERGVPPAHAGQQHLGEELGGVPAVDRGTEVSGIQELEVEVRAVVDLVGWQRDRGGSGVLQRDQVQEVGAWGDCRFG